MFITFGVFFFCAMIFLSFYHVLLRRDNFIHSTCCSCLHAGFATVSHAVGSPLKEAKMKSKLHRPASRELNERGMEMEKCGRGQQSNKWARMWVKMVINGVTRQEDCKYNPKDVVCFFTTLLGYVERAGVLVEFMHNGNCWGQRSSWYLTRPGWDVLLKHCRVVNYLNFKAEFRQKDKICSSGSVLVLLLYSCSLLQECLCWLISF